MTDFSIKQGIADKIYESVLKKITNIEIIEDEEIVNTTFLEEIATETVEQGFEIPVFFISEVNTIQRPLTNGTYHRTYNMVIRYFVPQTEQEKNKEMDLASTRLAEHMTRIPLKVELKNGALVDLDRFAIGRNISYNKTEDFLNFFVTYDVILKPYEEKVLMENLDLELYIKIKEKE